MDSSHKLDLKNLSPEERKARATELLTALSEAGEAAGLPEPTASERRNRYMLSLNAIFFATVFGSIMVLASSIYFHLIPAPLTYVTTQDGRIIELTPLKK